MAEWTRKTGDIVIAHISDLHFGTQNQKHSWDVLTSFMREQLKPELILVTGDIVDSPDRKVYEEAKQGLDALGAPYFVCPGNHDRHFKGNVSRGWAKVTGRSDTPAVFDQVFANHLVSPDTLKLHTILNQLQIGLFGIDSSEQADYFARGYVNPRMFPRLETGTRDADPDLVILLTHHHLQPIRNLEERHQNSLRSLSNLTLMVNAGTFLESMTRAHIDLVLHGHEHASHWARYGSLESGKAEVCVLGAGSATGNSAVGGCRLDSASLNAIYVARDHSVGLKVLNYDGGSWSAKKIKLFSSTEARRLRLLRRAGKLVSDPNGTVTKYVEFTRERDILIRWIFKNWKVEKRFEHVVQNSTGYPDNAVLKIALPGGKSVSYVFSFKQHPDKDYAWYVEGDIDDEYVDTLVDIEFSFKWIGGGLLTDDEMKVVQRSLAKGLLRREGFEFSSIFCSGPAAQAQLILSLPPEFAPPQIDVRVYDERDQRQPQEERELASRVLELDPGTYSLTVRYPRERWWYVLAWKPVPLVAGSEPEQVFQSFAQRSGQLLLEEFQRSKSLAALKSSARLSLYVKNSEGNPERVGHLDSTSSPNSRDVVTTGLRGDLTALGQAFWGVAAKWNRPADNQGSQKARFS